MNRICTFATVVIGLMLAGCGYHPLYGTTPSGSTTALELSSIKIDEQKTRLGQLIRNKLLSSIPPGTEAQERYRLSLTATSASQVQIEASNSEINRSSLRVNASYQLLDPPTGVVLNSGKTFSQVSYDRTTAEFANVQAESSAMDRAAEEIATDIRTRLAAYLSSRH